MLAADCINQSSLFWVPPYTPNRMQHHRTSYEFATFVYFPSVATNEANEQMQPAMIVPVTIAPGQRPKPEFALSGGCGQEAVAGFGRDETTRSALSRMLFIAPSHRDRWLGG